MGWDYQACSEATWLSATHFLVPSHNGPLKKLSLKLRDSFHGEAEA